MKEWKCKQVIDFDKSTTTVKEEKKRTPLDESDKLLRSISLHNNQEVRDRLLCFPLFL